MSNYFDSTAELEKMKGRKLRMVTLEDDKETIVFSFQDNTVLKYGVEGDCCSNSWIEHLEVPAILEGAEVVAIDELDSDEIEDTDYECLRLYQTIFCTDRGSITLEYRNSSNGYYGGYLVLK